MKNSLAVLVASLLFVVSACKKEQPSGEASPKAGGAKEAAVPATDEFSGMDAAYLSDLAMVHQRFKNFELALRTLQRAAAIETDPSKLADVQVRLGEVLQASGKEEDALKAFESAMAGLTDKSAKARLALKIGQQHRQAKRFDEAQKSLQVAAAEGSADYVKEAALIEMIQIWTAQGTLKDELPKLDGATDALTMKVLARGYSQAGEPKKAVELLKKLSAANPNDASYLAQLGNLCYLTDAVSEGISYYEKVAEKVPAQRAHAYERIAWGYSLQKKNSEAAKWAAKLGALGSEKDSSPLIQQANIYARLNMPADAIAAYRKAIAATAEPAKFAVKAQYASFLLSNKKSEEAVKVLDEILSSSADENTKKNAQQLRDAMAAQAPVKAKKPEGTP